MAPQNSLAQWSASAAMQVVSRRRESEVRVPWLHNLATAYEEAQDDQTDSEAEETKEDEQEEEAAEQFSEVRAQLTASHSPEVRSRGPANSTARHCLS